MIYLGGEREIVIFPFPSSDGGIKYFIIFITFLFPPNLRSLFFTFILKPVSLLYNVLNK